MLELRREMIARANRPSSLVDWVDAPRRLLLHSGDAPRASWEAGGGEPHMRRIDLAHHHIETDIRLEEAMEGGRVLGEWPSGDRLPHFRAAQLTSPQGFSGQTIPCKPGQMGSLFRLPLLKGTRTFTVQGAVIAVIIVVKEL